MKALAPTLGLFFLSLMVFNNSMAQKASYTTPGGISIGFGAGYAYQKSDLANSKGYGFDFIFGSKLYQKENAFLSVDWKFRFLAGVNKAYDHRINADNTYSNIRYRFFSYDVEVGLTLNRLRERTGIILTGFAGAGITHGRTFTDLYDAGNNLYDYGGIDPNRDSKSVYNDLITLSDGDFETSLVNKAAVLPTAGLYLGYQFSRSFALGIEFKTNLCLTEGNSLVGINIDNRVISGSGIDRNNYVSLGFRWRMGRGSSSRSGTNNYSSGTTNTNTQSTNTGNLVVAGSLPHPSVNITNPASGYVHAESPMQTIRATIQNVSGPNNISFYHNGFPNNSFTYNPNTKTFMASVRLREGENSIRIKATNQQWTAEDQAMITLENSLKAAIPAPTVQFTSPAGNQITTSSDRIDVTASVKNVSNKQNIQLTLNGSTTPFEYYPISGLVKTSAVLIKGVNNILIQGSNETGSAQDQLAILFTDPDKIAPPTVRFINPAIPVEVIDKRFPLSAETQNVRGRNDVKVMLNGNSIRNFSFDAEGRVYVSLFLQEGLNAVEVNAINEAGSATESTSIVYYAPVYQEPMYQEPIYQEPVYQEPIYHVPATRSSPPVINIFNPHVNPLRTQEPSEELHATVLHVKSKENIGLYVNGLNFRDFNYNNTTKSLTARLGLSEGENILTIRAQNESGEDLKEQVFIKESRPCPLPVIKLIDPVQGQGTTNQQAYTLKAEVHNIADRNQLSLTANGKPVSFSFSNHVLSTSIRLLNGLNTFSLIASNECGEDHVSTRISYDPAVVVVPCNPPTVSFTLHEVNRNDATHELKGSVSGVKSKANISLTLDGRAFPDFRFTHKTRDLSASFKLAPGSHTVVVSVNNSCGTDNRGTTVIMEEPCSPPTVSFTLQEANRKDATHELRGSVSGVKNKADISLTLDGRAYNGFQFAPASGGLSAKLKLTPGSHTLVVKVNNACGTDSKSESIILEEEVEEEACGIRINPGNADWQFCLVTPSGTFNRQNLSNSNFSYSGRASSLYIKPIAGGGNATVNGKPYTLRSGQYYLFTGNVNVKVSTKNPGSMGQWSVCITTNRAPVYGNGNTRPTSPCEVKNDSQPKAKNNDKQKANENVQPKAKNDDRSRVKNNERSKADNDVKPGVKEDENSNRKANNRSPRTGTRR